MARTAPSIDVRTREKVVDLDPPGVPDGAEHRLLVIPPDPTNFEVVLQAEASRGGRGDPAVHQDELESVRETLPSQVLQHQVAGPVLVGRSGHDHGSHWKAGDVDRHDALRALGATVGATLVVEREPAVRGAPGKVSVDDDHRGHLFRPTVLPARDRVQHRQRLRPRAVPRPTTELRPDPRPRPERLREVAPMTPICQVTWVRHAPHGAHATQPGNRDTPG